MTSQQLTNELNLQKINQEFFCLYFYQVLINSKNPGYVLVKDPLFLGESGRKAQQPTKWTVEAFFKFLNFPFAILKSKTKYF